jgi:hypothetical protein
LGGISQKTGYSLRKSVGIVVRNSYATLAGGLRQTAAFCRDHYATACQTLTRDDAKRLLPHGRHHEDIVGVEYRGHFGGLACANKLDLRH